MSTSLSFFIICVAIIILAHTPVNGYELSIYQGTPIIFWIAIVAGMINGGLLLLRYYNSGNKLWTVGLLEIVLCHLLIVSVYLLRGSFYLDRGDSLSYIGYSIDLINEGSIPWYNFYPFFTVLMSLVTELTGIPPIWVTQLLPPLTLMIYTLSMYCWAKSIFPERLFVASMLFASVPIFFAGFLAPLYYQSLAVMVLPLLFYCLRRGATGDGRFRAIAFILIIFFVLTHQIVAMGVLLFMAIMFLIEQKAPHGSRSVSPALVLFVFVTLFAWIFTQGFLTHSVTSIFQQILDSFSGQSTFTYAQTAIAKVGIWSTIRSVLVFIADDLVFLFLSLLAGVVIWKKASRLDPIFVYFLCLVGGCSMLLVLMFIATVHSSPVRLINLNFAMIFSVPLVGYLLYRQRNRGHRLKAGLIIVAILFSIFASTASFYWDPTNLNPNGTISASEVPGNNWIISLQDEHRNSSILFNVPSRFADMLYGREYKLEHPNIVYGVMDPGDHFKEPLSANQSYTGSYLIVTTFDQEAYTKVWPDFGRFTSNDFQAIDESMVISKIYANPGISCYICQ